MQRLYIIAGEKSGDEYGATLVQSLKALQPDLGFYGFGGDEMARAGVQLSRNLPQLEIIGFTEVLAKYPTIRKNFKVAKSDLLRLKPDALILIDYPGFNLSMAKWAFQKGIRVFYYISPQTWAWNRKRNKTLAKFTEEVFCILPFEEDFLRNDGVNATFVGHPMLDKISDYLAEDPKLLSRSANIKRIAVLPGSRLHEVQKLSPVLTELIPKMPDHEFLIAGIKGLPGSVYEAFETFNNVEIIYDRPLDVMKSSDIGLIKSGTSTLQAALLQLPQIVFYKVSPISAFIVRRIAKVPYVSLPNLILGKALVPELLQNDFNAENIQKAIDEMEQVNRRSAVQLGYLKMRQCLGENEKVADRVARRILDRMN